VLSYSAHGVVIDPERYEQAVRRRADELGRDSSDIAQSSYFPAFKAS
jgi:hypothetical protein